MLTRTVSIASEKHKKTSHGPVVVKSEQALVVQH